jgi:thioredoxin reductase
VISSKAKEQVLKYETVTFEQDEALSGEKTKDGFAITTKKGHTYSAKKLLFATGVRDVLPNISGFAECWGKTIIHCPYCHGYEFKDAVTGIFANGQKAFHVATLVTNLTKSLVIVSSGEAEFTLEQRSILQKHSIDIIESKITSVEQTNGAIQSVVFEDGTKRSLSALYAALPFEQQTDIPKQLGCEFTEFGHISVDLFQKTTVPGIYACGDNSTMMRSVAYAVSAGNIAGGMINHEISIEMF